jgi:hypothetical protein
MSGAKGGLGSLGKGRLEKWWRRDKKKGRRGRKGEKTEWESSILVN